MLQGCPWEHSEKPEAMGGKLGGIPRLGCSLAPVGGWDRLVGRSPGLRNSSHVCPLNEEACLAKGPHLQELGGQGNWQVGYP